MEPTAFGQKAPVSIKELEVYVTQDGLGRAAIVERDDRLLCIYMHWQWSVDDRGMFNIEGKGLKGWIDDETPVTLLYEDREPETGLYGTLDDARRQIRSLKGFSDAQLKPLINIGSTDKC